MVLSRRKATKAIEKSHPAASTYYTLSPSLYFLCILLQTDLEVFIQEKPPSTNIVPIQFEKGLVIFVSHTLTCARLLLPTETKVAQKRSPS